MHISEIGFCSRPQRVGRVRRRVRAHHRAGPLCRRRHGERAAQLHARRLHQRLGRRRGRDGLMPSKPTSRTSMRPTSQRERDARAGADQARGRHSAEPDRVQDAPPGQRLSAAAEGHRASTSSAQRRLAEVREDMEERMMARNAHELLRALEAQLDPATAPTWPRTPRCYRDGEPLGPLSPAHGLSREGQRELVLPHAAAASRTASMTSEKRAVRALRRADRRRGEGPLRQAAHPRHAPDPPHHSNRKDQHASRLLTRQRFRWSSTTPNASPTRAAPSASTSVRSTCCASAR